MYASLTLAFIFAFGFYLYYSVLPYQFPNQWEPGSESFLSSGEYDSNNEDGEFLGNKVKSAYVDDLPLASTDSNVLGDHDSEKRIEVDLTNQMVYAYEGDIRVMEFLISSGKWGRTPTGEFTIQYKVRSQTMKGGSKELGTYYYLPNVQFVQFFGNSEIPWWRGFSFHGTYWHENFGTPMSHGCINMRNEDAQKLYEWAGPKMGDKRTLKATEENPGTKVIIYGKAP